jgi:E3 ubiquitin-protein ligase HUWE1
MMGWMDGWNPRTVRYTHSFLLPHILSQVDLYDWIHALNCTDLFLRWSLSQFPQQLLIAPQSVGSNKTDNVNQEDLLLPAETVSELETVPVALTDQTITVLTFLSNLLHNCTSKSLFQSVGELTDYLAAADDCTADLALRALQALSIPPALHKQQAPEVHPHQTALHNAGLAAAVNHSPRRNPAHARLTAAARGWGTRGMGLGLYQAVAADDSAAGQGALPSTAGQVLFSYYYQDEDEKDAAKAEHMREIHLTEAEIVPGTDRGGDDSNVDMAVDDDEVASEEDSTDQSASKRRRIGTATKRKRRLTRSTAELFFLALDKAGGRSKIPADRVFSLLADIRLARSFHSQASRVQAVERRLRALITILHAHPSQEIMSGYFQAQPELCVEIVDLLRPTVSAANVSAASARSVQQSLSQRQDAIASLASSQQAVPFSVRMLALEALTALVTRRDGSTGALSSASRLSSVLTELGVGKGQYLGFLPTLIRYALASLGSVSLQGSTSGQNNEADASMDLEPESTAFEIGLAFVEATMAPEPPRIIQVERALEFIDSVLTLTSAVVSTPTGTSALTDCGLIPALLTTLGMNTEPTLQRLLSDTSASSREEWRRVRALMRFVTAQAVQILEGAIVTHNNALIAFHDLHGVEVLTNRLSQEIASIKASPGGEKPTQPEAPDAMDVDTTAAGSSDQQDQRMEMVHTDEPRIRSSQRVLLFSIVTCLTVVFHQESTSSSITTPSGGVQLRKKELTEALIEIMDDVNSYGGNLASLVATLLSDVMNSDPHVVHYVQSSGIAKSFIDMVLGKKLSGADGIETYEPIIPPVPELIMAIPNVLSALALTEDGAKAVFEANPFPSLLRIFYHPNYAMPRSRCLLNEMTAIVGTGLDEIMRHVERLKPQVLKAMADAMSELVSYAEDLTRREAETFNTALYVGAPARTEIEDERSCLIQYVLNFGQLLEQILHNEDHCEPFVEAGGLNALLRLFPASMPSGFQFLSHVSSLSSPSVSTVHHATIEESLSLAFRCIELRYDPYKLVSKIIEAVHLHMDALEESQRVLFGGDSACFALDKLPREPFYNVSNQDSTILLDNLSLYLRNVVCVQWITSLLGTSIKAVCQRSQETGNGWGLNEREWKNELSSEAFKSLFERVSVFHQSSMFEVCRVRTEDGFEEMEKERYVRRTGSLRYRLRIVCPEGAVVRDGIEIDSCASVGSMEMGEIVDSFDRCINSSGILRYHTHRGWVSEMTRGHGREPIAEVISLWEGDDLAEPEESDSKKKRIEASLLDLRSVGAGVLARGQTSYSELFSALSKVVLQGVRSLPVRTLSFEDDSVGAHVLKSMKLLTLNLRSGISQANIVETVNRSLDPEVPSASQTINDAGAAMYLGSMLSHLQACLFDDRRERRMVNFPLLVSLLSSDSFVEKTLKSPTANANGKDIERIESIGLFDAVRFVFKHSLSDFAGRAPLSTGKDASERKAPSQRVSRSTAASIPPLISLLRRLVSTPVSTSPAASIMSRMKWKDVALLVGQEEERVKLSHSPTDDDFFQPEHFVKGLQFAISRVVREAWLDPRFAHAPPFLVHPIASLVGEVIVALEEASKKKPPLGPVGAGRADGAMLLSDYFRDRRRQEEPAVPEEEFEAGEDAIARLSEMGFSRDHALDALEGTQSNRVEVAMEYALSHPPPTPSSIERRRVVREGRARRREDQRNQASGAADGAQEPGDNVAGDPAEDNQASAGVAPSPPSLAADANGADNSTAMEADASLVAPPNNNDSAVSDKEGAEVSKSQEELALWVKDAPRICCSILNSISCSSDSLLSEKTPEGRGNGDGDVEALTVVICSFLLDLCHRYPEKRSEIVTQVLELMRTRIDTKIEEQTSDRCVSDADEASLAALCHAAVLFTRALPKTRILVLQKGLVHSLVSCVHTFVKSQIEVDSPRPISWPMWLAPSLLFLDIMAQPVVAFSDGGELLKVMIEGGDLSLSQLSDEFKQVREEHKAQAANLSDMASSIFSALSDDENPTSKEKGANSEDTAGVSTDAGNEQANSNMAIETNSKEKESPFATVPAYFPLLPMESVETCLSICLGLLGNNDGNSGKVAPPPGITHATLLLLLRLLRTPKLSSQCVRTGVAEGILALPSDCKFTGNTGLVTLIFRRLLEDESTLQAAMETEIRSTVTKLHLKQRGPLAKGDTPTIAVRSFIEAVTPLLCRDPSSFLKATALSVKVEAVASNSSPEVMVSLLSPDERLRNTASLTDIFTSLSSDNVSKFNGRRSSKSKSSHQHHKGAKRGPSPTKKTKKEKGEGQKGVSVLTTPTSPPTAHVTYLIINRILLSVRAEPATNEIMDPFAEDTMFLWTGNLLEILADLVLAVPACASAVHNYRSHRSKDKAGRSALVHHALSGCPAPPKTFVSFLLHSILPQDRWGIRNDHQIWERRKDDGDAEYELINERKKRAYRLTKVSHAAARVLVALVARPGEGRKRVIADATFALSGGRLGHGSDVSLQGVENESSSMNTSELHALQAWGELCLGFAAPRSNGKNLESASALCIESLRLMLENGMAHALLYAMHRVRLFHPMASSTYSALLLPFEVITRASVTSSVTELVGKGSGVGNEAAAVSDSNVLGSQQKDDGLADEMLVEEGGEGHVQAFGMNQVGEANIDYEVLVESEENEMSDADDADDMVDGADEEGSEQGGHSGSDDESEEEESEEESEDDSDIEDDDDEGSDMDDSQEMSGDDEVEEEGDWNVDYNDGFAGDNPAELQEFDEVEDEGTERVDQGLGEGWTRIESSGFGGMLLGGRRNALGPNPGDPNPRSRGFVDAAEAMIGNLLRTGEISTTALAEIEGTLGIRIMSNNRSLRAVSGIDDAAGGLGDLAVRAGTGNQPARGRRGEVVGTLPHIHQRSQPEVGYSAFGSSGRWVEVSSMEYVYGGPSVTAGSRNYDLISPMETLESSPATHPSLSQLDLQLFPGGPALAASARTQHALHPLLCGVDLPPVNSLVSDLLPHGVRATRRGQMTTRRPGDWTDASFSPGGYLVSTSNGNIIRSNRSHSGAPLGNGMSNRPVAGPVGWTDDGLPFDATVEEFSLAFERAIRESTRRPEQAANQEAEVEAPPDAHIASDLSEVAEVDRAEAEGVADARSTAPENDSSQVDSASVSRPAETLQNGNLMESESSPGAGSDGERVASSLASGLRLSDGIEGSALSDQISTGNTGSVTAATAIDESTASADVPMEEAAENPTRADDIRETSAMESQQLETSEVAASAPHGDQVGTSASEQVAQGDTSAGNDPVVEDTIMDAHVEPNANGLVCPPDIDIEVFNSLPQEMQQDCVDQFNATQELAAQLSGSTLDPEVLAALPEDMRREVIEQDRRERQMREQQQEAPADPAHAEEMDNASFIASLSPELREEILLTADDLFLNSLPPSIIAEAQILRERASAQHRRLYDDGAGDDPGNAAVGAGPPRGAQAAEANAGALARKKHRSGKLRVETDRANVVFLPETLSSPFGKSDVKALIRLLFLLSPVRPPRLLQKVFLNICGTADLRNVLATAFVKLLHEDGKGAASVVESLEKDYPKSDDWRRTMDTLFADEGDFPPSVLLGAAPEVPDADAFSTSLSLLRRKQGSGAAASVAANLPTSAGGSRNDQGLPPVVAGRIIDTILQLCRGSPRFSLHILVSPIQEDGESSETSSVSTGFEKLLDLLDKPMYSKSSANLDQLLTVLESAVSPLSHLAKNEADEYALTQKDVDTASTSGKEWVVVPRVAISQSRLQLLCSILRMETCRDSAFTKVNTIVRRLCRVEMNRGYVLAELGSVAHALGVDAIRDLRALRIRMDDAVAQYEFHRVKAKEAAVEMDTSPSKSGTEAAGAFSSSVTLSTSTSELKLLRVLQTLQALCSDSSDESGNKKHDNSMLVTEELVHLFRQMRFDDLWDELSSCLKIVQVLEGVSSSEDDSAEDTDTNEDGSDEQGTRAKKLRNSSAGLLTRFLPSVEAFFVANASATRPKESSPSKEGEPATHSDDIGLDTLVGGERMLDFVAKNKVILNALIRHNAGLMDKGLRALVQVPRCRVFLDFDVKRQWFKTQVRRLRQHASRRHGSLRLSIRRTYVFEDAYHQLRLRNSEEMRGRLHITFRNEEGVDAGGLSREFFGILAKEIFNPNYALFTSTEDGCTFQPNSNSSINPDHLSYFRFVGRIVGKAVADGFLLDAHFTRSLYKHMLGIKLTHHDMEAIDPDYYRNLKTILEFNLADIGLELTFSIEDHSFGRSQVIDLLPNGRTIHVTEETKEEYVRLVCEHRMTTAISSQIKAYLDGFYELVSPELIAVFTPRELELLISGLPDIDVHDLKKNTDYVAWKATDREIQWFWNILFGLSRNEKATFLQFVTGSSKVPLSGFSELQGMRGIQKFSIHKVGGSKGALMSAHTCFNSLDLPTYSSEEEMREKLTYAINEGGGAFMFA